MSNAIHTRNFYCKGAQAFALPSVFVGQAVRNNFSVLYRFARNFRCDWFVTLDMTRQTSLQPQTPDNGNPTPDPIALRRAEYTELIRLWEADLLRTARRLCAGNAAWAQDLTQDTLIRGYEAYVQGRFQPGTNARAWLHQILMNLFINDYKRRQKWEAGIDVDTLTAQGNINPPGTDDRLEERPGHALLAGTLDEPLERALAALAPDLRACIVMVDIDGAEYVEAAKALGVPVGTIRSRLARARMKLHDLLYEYARQRRRI